MRFAAASLSEQGPRPVNEDAVGIWHPDATRLAAAIADGLGGHSGGAAAARLAVEIFGQASVSGTKPDLRLVAEKIHSEILVAQKRSYEFRSMATTLSAGIFSPSILEFVHCGDSRISVSRGNGIIRLTKDHSEAQRLFAAGKLSRSELVQYPRRNILESALGIAGDPLIDTSTFEIRPGDKVFFTTDGAHNKIFIRELLGFARNADSPDALVSDISREMKKRGADDNYSLICVFVFP